MKLHRIYAKNPKSTENYANYFRVLFKLNLFDEIKELYSSLNEENLQNEEIMYIVSKTDPDNKYELLEDIIKTDSNNINAKLDLGILCFKKQDYDYAKELFECVVQAENNPKAYYYLGLIFNKK